MMRQRSSPLRHFKLLCDFRVLVECQSVVGVDEEQCFPSKLKRLTLEGDV